MQLFVTFDDVQYMDYKLSIFQLKCWGFADRIANVPSEISLFESA